MIESELKARLADPAAVREALAARATPERAVYRDTYYDTPAEEFDQLDGRSFLATVVRVPELDGTFLEVETMASEDDVAVAIDAVRRLLAELGVAEAELTTELYTDAVRAARRS